MSKSRITVSLKNFSEFSSVLDALPDQVRAKVIPKAVGAGAKPIAKAVKARAPRRTGALHASITSVVRTYVERDAISVIGPDKDYFHGGKRVKSGQDRRGADRPANYAHLVENGFKRRDGKQQPATGFMRAGVAASEGEAAEEFYRVTADGIDAETAKQLERLKKK